MTFRSPFTRNLLTTIIAATIVIMLTCAFSVTSLAEDWYQWRGPNRDGISNEKGWSSTWPTSGPKKLWEKSLGVGYATVAVSNGRVYTMGNVDKTDTVYCFNADTGAEIWKHSYPCATESGGHPGPASTPTVDGEEVYTLSREGDLYCFNKASGDVVWHKNVKDFGAKSPNWDYACSPLILGDMIVIDAGMALALDKSNGNLIWNTKDYGKSWDIKAQGGGYSSPFAFELDGVQRLAVFNSSGLVILDPKNGKELSIHPWRTDWNVNAAIPIVSRDKVFISSGYNVGCALLQMDGNNLSVVWQNKNMRNQLNSCVLWEGHLYGFDDKQLRCLDWETGDVKWTKKGLGKGSLMIADGKLIIMSDKGQLVIAEASPDSFNELASAKVLSGLCWTVPVLSGGKIYCRSHPGVLVCLDVSK